MGPQRIRRTLTTYPKISIAPLLFGSARAQQGSLFSFQRTMPKLGLIVSISKTKSYWSDAFAVKTLFDFFSFPKSLISQNLSVPSSKKSSGASGARLSPSLAPGFLAIAVVCFLILPSKRRRFPPTWERSCSQAFHLHFIPARHAGVRNRCQRDLGLEAKFLREVAEIRVQ